MTEIGTFLTTLAGAAGALLGVWLTNKNAEKRQVLQLGYEARNIQRQLVRERGEELYEQATYWTRAIQNMHHNTFRVMHGQLTWEQADELNVSEMKNLEGKYSFTRLKMIIDIYFCPLRAELEKVKDARDALNRNETIFRKSTKAEHRSLVDKHDTLSKQFTQVAEAFQLAIARKVGAQVSAD